MPILQKLNDAVKLAGFGLLCFQIILYPSIQRALGVINSARVAAVRFLNNYFVVYFKFEHKG